MPLLHATNLSTAQLPPVTALVFSMLIVRSRTNVHPRPTSTSAQSTHIRFWSTTRASTVHTEPLGVEIDLERVVHTDTDAGTRGTYDSEAGKTALP